MWWHAHETRDCYVLTAGDHTVRILPPLVTSQDELERGLAILEQVI